MDYGYASTSKSMVNKTMKVRILVVDDDVVCLAMTASVLKVFKYEVVTFNCPLEALTTLRMNQDSFDVILSDVYMPLMTGVTLQRIVKRELGTPVILMSADEKKKALLQSLEDGIGIFIVKPPRLDDLKNLWQYVTSRKKNVETTQATIPKDIEPSNAIVAHKPIVEVRPPQSIQRIDNEPLYYDLQTRKSTNNDDKEKGSEEKKVAKTTRKNKTKLIWTTTLHNRFLEAMEAIGITRAVPKKIMEFMNVPGLTRENIASHLQKYRIYLRRLKDTNIVMQHGMPINWNEKPFRSTFSWSQFPSLANNSFLLRYSNPSSLSRRQLGELVDSQGLRFISYQPNSLVQPPLNILESSLLDGQNNFGGNSGGSVVPFSSRDHIPFEANNNPATIPQVGLPYQQSGPLFRPLNEVVVPYQQSGSLLGSPNEMGLPYQQSGSLLGSANETGLPYQQSGSLLGSANETGLPYQQSGSLLGSANETGLPYQQSGSLLGSANETGLPYQQSGSLLGSANETGLPYQQSGSLLGSANGVNFIGNAPMSQVNGVVLPGPGMMDDHHYNVVNNNHFVDQQPMMNMQYPQFMTGLSNNIYGSDEQPDSMSNMNNNNFVSRTDQAINMNNSLFIHQPSGGASMGSLNNNMMSYGSQPIVVSSNTNNNVSTIHDRPVGANMGNFNNNNMMSIGAQPFVVSSNTNNNVSTIHDHPVGPNMGNFSNNMMSFDAQPVVISSNTNNNVSTIHQQPVDVGIGSLNNNNNNMMSFGAQPVVASANMNNNVASFGQQEIIAPADTDQQQVLMSNVGISTGDQLNVGNNNAGTNFQNQGVHDHKDMFAPDFTAPSPAPTDWAPNHFADFSMDYGIEDLSTIFSNMDAHKENNN